MAGAPQPAARRTRVLREMGVESLRLRAASSNSCVCVLAVPAAVRQQPVLARLVDNIVRAWGLPDGACRIAWVSLSAPLKVPENTPCLALGEGLVEGHREGQREGVRVLPAADELLSSAAAKRRVWQAQRSVCQQLENGRR